MESADNLNWKTTYKEYADKMLEYKEKKQELGEKFHEWEPLKFYLTVGNAKTGKENLKVSVRYLGQTVAIINVDDKGVFIDTTKQNKTNERDFLCPKNIELENAEWDSKQAKEFREYFRVQRPDRVNGKKKNEEHRLESALLTEFSKKNSIDKLFCGIQPITFAGFRFPMPTAIKSSDFIKFGGGHIDILARTTGRKITVFELKDENIQNEPIGKVLEQATAYAVFLIKLLRSDSGKEWYKILGFKGEIPKILTVRVCGAMPVKKDGSYEKFESFNLPCGNDILEYHWLYFEEENRKIKNIESSINKNKGKNKKRYSQYRRWAAIHNKRYKDYSLYCRP